MRIVNILGIVVGLYLIFRSFSLVRKREEDVWSFILWLGVGVSLTLTSSIPKLFSFIMKILGMERRAYAIFTVGILGTYLLIFRLTNTIRKMENDISEVNEEVSLMKARHEYEEDNLDKEIE